jgi:hypothetical protein
MWGFGPIPYIMKKLNLQVKITPKFTAEDWQLYSFSDEPENAKLSREAARAINAALKKAVNSGTLQPKEVFDTVYIVMDKYSVCGATDTESRGFLHEILEHIYR